LLQQGSSLEDILGALGDGEISTWTEKHERKESEQTERIGLKSLLRRYVLNVWR